MIISGSSPFAFSLELLPYWKRISFQQKSCDKVSVEHGCCWARHQTRKVTFHTWRAAAATDRTNMYPRSTITVTTKDASIVFMEKFTKPVSKLANRKKNNPFLFTASNNWACVERLLRWFLSATTQIKYVEYYLVICLTRVNSHQNLHQGKQYLKLCRNHIPWEQRWEGQRRGMPPTVEDFEIPETSTSTCDVGTFVSESLPEIASYWWW